MRHLATYAFFIILAQLVGITTGFFFQPGDWFDALAKPVYNPPGWVFGPVWTVLYVLIGIAGALVWRWDPQSWAVKLWFFQMVLNGAWTVVFFGLHQIEWALMVILLLWWAIIAFMKQARAEVASATWLFLPYLLWVSFATLLNAAIAALN